MAWRARRTGDGLPWPSPRVLLRFLLAVTAPALAQSPTDRGLFSPTPFGAQTATAPSLPNDTPEKPSRLPRWVVFDFASGIKTVEFADGSLHEEPFDPDPLAQMALSPMPCAVPRDAMVTGSVSSGPR
jgi:hypothetical protein